jgi:hypothetical protein
MSLRRKKCRCCHELFPPYPQTYRQQITCEKPECRAWRKRRKWERWSERNPLYGASRRAKQKRWRQKHGAAYMRRYRKEHAAYVKRNRRWQRARDAKRRNLVKPTAWSAVCREKRRQNHALRLLVKPTEWPELLFHELDGVWAQLGGISNLVKPTAIDPSP